MRVKRLFSFLTVLTIVITSLPVCSAAGNVSLSQAYIKEQYINVFVAGDIKPDNLNVKVSNKPSKVTDSGLLSDKNVIVRTTLLLDISTSMPSELRGDVKSYIDTLIQNIGKNEQYKIVTFGEQLTVLQDFTSDRYDLSTASSKIEFNGKQSKIYDAIFNTMPKVQPVDDLPCYYRTIVITDGVDETTSGVTKEELYLKLQADTYPIDVMAVSKVKQTEPEKKLSALTRISGGHYDNLNSETDVSSISSSFEISDLLWVRAEIPNELLDGSTRQIDISDGGSSLEFDIKIPVFDSPVDKNQEASEPTDKIAVTEKTSEQESPSSLTDGEKENSKSIMTLFGEYTTVVYIGGGVALIIIISVIIAVTVTRNKKKLGYQNNQNSVGGRTEISNNADYDKTEYIGEVDYSGSQYTIKLSDPNNLSKNWTLPVSGELIIGRGEHCAIRLDEKSVSREQCKIIQQDAGLKVVHLSQTNKTSLNGLNVTGSSHLQSGDTLKFGRVVLHIDYIQSLGTPVPPREPEKVASGSKTESIF